MSAESVTTHSTAARPPMARALVVVLAVLLAVPAIASAHGGEELAEQPARALVQQGLGLLTQQGDTGEAAERLEAAIASDNKKDVNIADVEKALKALEAGDAAAAVASMNDALTEPEEAERPADEEPSEPAEGEEGAAADQHEEGEVAEASFEDQTQAIEPEQGTAEWVGLVLGVGLVGVGGGLLLRRRGES